jgi:RNA polymerase sigma-70 factor, ECF subfamily
LNRCGGPSAATDSQDAAPARNDPEIFFTRTGSFAPARTSHHDSPARLQEIAARRTIAEPDRPTMNTAALSTPPDFQRLLAELRPRLHRYCARMTGSVLDGEDVVQDTLLKASEGFDAQTVRNAEGWLFRIAHNAAMDFLRQRARDQAVFAPEPDIDQVVDTQAEADSRHVAATALRTFMRLPASQRSTVILADVLGYALDEAAQVMGTTLPAVKAALHRGRVRLRELAQQPDDAAPPAPLSASDQALLTAYAERFNARDFDGLRDMLGEEVRLDLVGRHKTQGRANVSNYFTNYAKFQGLRFTPAAVEGKPALLVDTTGSEGPGAPGYFVVLEWQGGKVAAIRDFHFARYAAAEL